jgi:hypothetical protein
MANVPGIMSWGPRWFREVGTDESPGTIVCTMSGDVDHAGVGEVPCGTPLREIVETIGGGARHGHEIVAVMSGVANPVVPARLLDTPASYEGMQAIGSGLGASGFLVFDDSTDLVALAHGVARFLGVESCGQCTPCKQDGVALAELFGRILDGDAHDDDIAAIDDHLRTITDGARCFLATQHQRVVGSIVSLCRDGIRARVHARRPSSDRVLIAPLVAVDDGGREPSEARDAPRRDAEHRVEDVEADPEAPLYSSVPLETDDGTVVVQQQNVGPGEEGSGEWPDPHTPPRDPAPGAG